MPIDTHGFSDEQAEDILREESVRRDFIHEELQRRIYRGELEATDADGVVTMRDLQ